MCILSITRCNGQVNTGQPPLKFVVNMLIREMSIHLAVQSVDHI